MQCQLPGTTEWLTLADLQASGVVGVAQEGGTACAITPDIAGTAYRLSPLPGSILTADAWSA